MGSSGPAEGETRRAPSFGRLLKAFRSSAALTQEELAERSGLSADTVSALERGSRQRPHATTVSHLVRSLGLEGEARLALVEAARALSHRKRRGRRT
jgi:transcriptional regulator with XRE-family HTH domain